MLLFIYIERTTHSNGFHLNLNMAHSNRGTFCAWVISRKEFVNCIKCHCKPTLHSSATFAHQLCGAEKIIITLVVWLCFNVFVYSTKTITATTGGEVGSTPKCNWNLNKQQLISIRWNSDLYCRSPRNFPSLFPTALTSIPAIIPIPPHPTGRQMSAKSHIKYSKGDSRVCSIHCGIDFNYKK